MRSSLLAAIVLCIGARAAACSSGGSGAGCEKNRDCAAGEACVGGRCAPAGSRPQDACSRDDQCAIDELCDLAIGACRPSEETNSEAADASVPDARTPGSTDASTSPGDAGLPSRCAADPECGPPAFVCESAQCVPGCGRTGGVQCTGAATCNASTGRCGGAAPACRLDSDCGDLARVCVGAACVPRCDAAGGGCSGSSVCNAESGRCIPGGLALGADCTLDAQCANAFCLQLTSGADTFQVCSRGCGKSGDCPLGFTCASVSGMTLCLGGALFGTPPPPFDVASGGACSDTTNDCQSGWCNTGMGSCMETCARNSDCSGFGGNCYAYESTVMSSTVYDHVCHSPSSGAAAGASCTSNTGCRSGICSRYTDRCAQHCCSDASCAASESCVPYDLDPTNPVKICAPRAAGAGTGALGAACTQASDCESELCAPLDPSDAASAQKCSTTCCTDADCAALPLGGRCRPFNGPIADTLLSACVPG